MGHEIAILVALIFATHGTCDGRRKASSLNLCKPIPAPCHDWCFMCGNHSLINAGEPQVKRICQSRKKIITSPSDCWNAGNPCYCEECTAWMDEYFIPKKPTAEDIDWGRKSSEELSDQ